MFIGSGSLGHHLFQPSGAGGGGGKILTVHKCSPPVVPIDPLSHSRISSFDNTRAAQELRSRIQSKRRCEASRHTGGGTEKHSQGTIRKPAELPAPTSSSPLAPRRAATRNPNTSHAARAATPSSIQCLPRSCCCTGEPSPLQAATHCTPAMSVQARGGSWFCRETTEGIPEALQLCTGDQEGKSQGRLAHEGGSPYELARRCPSTRATTDPREPRLGQSILTRTTTPQPIWRPKAARKSPRNSAPFCDTPNSTKTKQSFGK